MFEGYNIFNAIWDFLTGKLEFASKSIATERMNICLNCEIRNPKFNICTICGCYLPAKTKLKKSECPMELW